MLIICWPPKVLQRNRTRSCAWAYDNPKLEAMVLAFKIPKHVCCPEYTLIARLHWRQFFWHWECNKQWLLPLQTFWNGQRVSSWFLCTNWQTQVGEICTNAGRRKHTRFVARRNDKRGQCFCLYRLNVSEGKNLDSQSFELSRARGGTVRDLGGKRIPRNCLHRGIQWVNGQLRWFRQSQRRKIWETEKVNPPRFCRHLCNKDYLVAPSSGTQRNERRSSTKSRLNALTDIQPFWGVQLTKRANLAFLAVTKNPQQDI